MSQFKGEKMPALKAWRCRNLVWWSGQQSKVLGLLLDADTEFTKLDHANNPVAKRLDKFLRQSNRRFRKDPIPAKVKP